MKKAAYKANPGVEGSRGEGVPAGMETRAELHKEPQTERRKVTEELEGNVVTGDLREGINHGSH